MVVHMEVWVRLARVNLPLEHRRLVRGSMGQGAQRGRAWGMKSRSNSPESSSR